MKMTERKLKKIKLNGTYNALDLDGLVKYVASKQEKPFTLDEMKEDSDVLKEMIFGIMDNPNYAKEEFENNGVVFFQTKNMAVLDVLKQIDFKPYFSDILFKEDLEVGILALYKENNLYWEKIMYCKECGRKKGQTHKSIHFPFGEPSSSKFRGIDEEN